MPSIVLFDLDGTLSDSAPGILGALRHAFAVNDLPQLDARTERSLLGPPFATSLPPLIGDEKLAAVIGAYRERYAEGGMFDTELYPGLLDVLTAAKDAGRRLAVATSKPEHFAVLIVEHLGLTGYFETVGGDELDGSLPSKALVIEKVLGRLGSPATDEVIMVGDREHDVLGAAVHGLGCIGVRWGYAAPDELERAGAAPICADAAELGAALGLAGAGAGRR